MAAKATSEMRRRLLAIEATQIAIRIAGRLPYVGLEAIVILRSVVLAVRLRLTARREGLVAFSVVVQDVQGEACATRLR